MYSLPSPSSSFALTSITLLIVGAPSEPGANLNACTELEYEDILLIATLNPKLLGESILPL
jgi:hypothetical protein